MATGLFISANPSIDLLDRVGTRLSALQAAGDRVRVVFLYAEAARLVDPARLPPELQDKARSLVSCCCTSGASLLVCQSAVERLALTRDPDSPFQIGSLGQWFDLLHELGNVESFGA